MEDEKEENTTFIPLYHFYAVLCMWFIDDAQCIEYNQEYKNKRPSVDALEIKGGKSWKKVNFYCNAKYKDK